MTTVHVGARVHYVELEMGDYESYEVMCRPAEITDTDVPMRRPVPLTVSLRVIDPTDPDRQFKKVVLFDPGTPESEYQKELVRITVLPNSGATCDGLRHHSGTWHWPHE